MNPATACNQIKEFVQSGRYQDALSCFAQLPSPTAQEKRFAGHAYWGLGDFSSATVMLHQALKSGEQGSAVDLIQLKVSQDDIAQAAIEYENFSPKDLSPRDSVQFQLLGGEIAFRQSKLSIAKQRLNAAWHEAKACPEATTLFQSISQSLATTYHVLGYERKALGCLDEALLRASNIWESYIRINRARILFFLGRYDDSTADLAKTSHLARNNPQIAISYGIVQGLNSCIQDSSCATGIFYNIIKAGESQSENSFLIFQARFYLIGILIYTNQFDQARGQLCKLELHANTESENAMLELRRGQYCTALGQYEKALACLEIAHQSFYNLEWRRELGWTLLHKAHAYSKMNQSEKASECLDLVCDVVNIIENAAFLELERRFIGDLSALEAVASSYGLHALHNTSVLIAPIESRPAPRNLQFLAFGEPRLLTNGKSTPTKLNMGFSIMAYLLLYPHSTLERIVTDLFEQSKSVEAAKSYFHTARYQIQAACPYIRFAFNKITKTYSLETNGVPIDFDYHEVARLLHAPTENEFYQALELSRGPFLSGFEGAWIEEVRANMEWLLVRSGLKLVQEMYESGDFQACRRLTERLLKVEPFDEALNELLVRATREVEGALASRKAMSKVESQFLQEVGELPPTLAQLKSEMKFRVN